MRRTCSLDNVYLQLSLHEVHLLRRQCISTVESAYDDAYLRAYGGNSIRWTINGVMSHFERCEGKQMNN